MESVLIADITDIKPITYFLILDYEIINFSILQKYLV